MKKAKVVSQEYKQSRLMRSKRAVWITVATLATAGTIAVVVPTSNIPGFGYIAQVLGINSDATRDLTMADFASYAVGARGNKIAACVKLIFLLTMGAAVTAFRLFQLLVMTGLPKPMPKILKKLLQWKNL